MSHNLLQIIVALITGISCLAQDNVVRVKAPEDPGHQHKCWYLLMQSQELETETGLSIKDYGVKIASADALADGEMVVNHPEFQSRDKDLDQKRGEFVQNAYNLGKLLRDHHAELIDDLPINEIPKARAFKRKVDELAAESGTQWVPYIPGVTEYIFTDGFISGVKLDYQAYVDGYTLESYHWLSKSGITSLEIDLGRVTGGMFNVLEHICTTEGFKKIKQFKIDHKILREDYDRQNEVRAEMIHQNLLSLSTRGFLKNLESLEALKDTINPADLSTLLERLPNIKNIGDMAARFEADDLDYLLDIPSNRKPFHVREIVFFQLIRSGYIRDIFVFLRSFPTEDERAKILDRLFTEAIYQKKIGLRDLAWVTELYGFIPKERKDLQDKLVSVYLERHPQQISLARKLKERLKLDPLVSVKPISKKLFEKADKETHPLLVRLKDLTEGKITEAQYEQDFIAKENENSHYSKWKEYFSKKGRLDLLDGLAPETFETVLFEIPSEGLEVQLGSFRNERQGIQQDLPVKRIIKKSFRMRKTVVTVGQYLAYLADTAGAPTLISQIARHPKNAAMSLSKKNADKYAEWESKITGVIHRMPTAIESEYTARGGVISEYSYGNNTEEFAEHGRPQRFPQDQNRMVAQYLPNAYGLYDTMGFIHEWTSTRYTFRLIDDEYEPLDPNYQIYSIRGYSGTGPIPIISQFHLSLRTPEDISEYPSVAHDLRLVEELP